MTGFVSLWIVHMLLDSATIDVERYLYTEASPVLLDRHGRLLQVSLNTNDEWCLPVETQICSRYVREATIAVEDQRFEKHRGVDFLAAVRAGTQALLNRRVTSGASTLTMQLVKITDDTPRSISGKFGQMWKAMVLERNATKDDILEAYLNRVSYGGNLIGIGAASLRYFGKSSDELTLPEAALLAGIPKSPARFDPLRKTDEARERRNFVLRRMAREGFILEKRFTEIRARDLGVEWHDFPSHVPHLAGLEPGPLTIDLDEQARVQDLLRTHVAQFGAEVTHGAVIVLDVASGEVVARAGSPEFFSSKGGQIDMVTHARSPGSALKPFVFAEAMEQNRVYPSEVLLDGRLDYGDYAPGNYDGQFNGLVTATDALRYSLNIPAVSMLERVGVRSFQRRLGEVGLTTLRKSPEHYGLGLVLGNCEVRLDELAGGYLTLANMGIYRNVRLRRNEDDKQPGRRVWSQGVARAMYAMLEQPLPKELHRGLVRADVLEAQVCWKTGTSTGHHDAWAFVFNGEYVVGVWIGNADGSRSDRLVGATAALPLAGRVFRGSKKGVGTAWPSTDRLWEVNTCAVSGLPVNDWCPGKVTARISEEQFLNRTCRLHQAGRERGEVLTVWPANARHWDLAAITSRPKVEDSNDSEDKAFRALRIISPADHSEYRLSGVEGGDRVRLETSVHDGGGVHWYCDERYLGISSIEKPLYLRLSLGDHRISCMGAQGAVDGIDIVVR